MRHPIRKRRNEVFEHDRLGTWNVTSIRNFLRQDPEACRRINVPLDDPKTQTIVDHVRRRNVFRTARIDALTDQELAEPIIVLRFKDGALLLIDGTHRLLRLDRDGAAEVPVIILDEETARPFKII